MGEAGRNVWEQFDTVYDVDACVCSASLCGIIYVF